MNREFNLTRITGGNHEAIFCLKAWGDYLRAVDDIVDKGLWDSKHVTEALAFGCRFYSCPFYVKNAARLQMPCLLATSLWEVSVEWERCDELWRKQWADVLRHADIAFLGAMCLICCGWETTQEFTRVFLIEGRRDHIERYGEPK